MPVNALRLTVPALIVIGGIFVGTAGGARAPQRAPAVPGPEDWVAFSADLRLTHAEPHESTEGRFWRGRDGSTRLETWLVSNADRRIISIKNVTQRTHYLQNPDGQWSAAPMDVPGGGWRPKKWRADLPGLSEYPFKVDVLRGGTGKLDSPSGLSAYQFVTRQGNVSLLIPNLNFFPVLQQAVSTGRREASFNVEIKDQDPTLFDPPGGVAIRQVNEPRAIVNRREAVRRAASRQAGADRGVR